MKAAEGYLLALDIGTTTTRCLLFDLEGIPVGAAYREPPIHYPRPSWTEVDPEDWWESVVLVVRKVLEQSQVPRERILGIGLAGLMHALVPINDAGQPLSRAMLWMDQRCRPQVEWLTQKHGQIIEEMVGPHWALSTTPSAPKLRWIVEHRPELLQQTYKFLLAKDFIRLKLTGTIATDHSDAGGTCLYDQQKGDWSHPMLNAIGVGLEKMPLIHESAEVIGAVTEEAAQITGLIQGTPVVVGGGDVMCTRIGADACSYERACLYLGTAAWVSVVSPDTGRAAVAATATTGASVSRPTAPEACT